VNAEYFYPLSETLICNERVKALPCDPAVRRDANGGVDLNSGGQWIQTHVAAMKTGGGGCGEGGWCEMVMGVLLDDTRT
jgi:hypothetical protein